MLESSAVSLDTRNNYNTKEVNREVTNCETNSGNDAFEYHDYQERLCNNDQQGQDNILIIYKIGARVGVPSIFTVEVYCYCMNRDDGSKMVQCNVICVKTGFMLTVTVLKQHWYKEKSGFAISVCIAI